MIQQFTEQFVVSFARAAHKVSSAASTTNFLSVRTTVAVMAVIGTAAVGVVPASAATNEVTVAGGTPVVYTCATVDYYGPSTSCSGTVVVNPLPLCTISGGPNVSSASPATLCGPDGMASYVWLAGPQSAGSSAKRITVTVAGTYTLQIINSNGCVAKCSTTLVK